MQPARVGVWSPETTPQQVTASLGGDQDTVALYENGSSNASTGNAAVTQSDILSGQTIPNNNWVVVLKLSKGNYEMEAPVWM
jgi:hypothetical protein